jgi:hypothetical protein
VISLEGMRLAVQYTCAALLSVAAVACKSDASVTKDLVGVWRWNPRDNFPPEQIKETGFPTPDLEAIQFNADGQYVHVQGVPGYETIVAGKPFHVSERWWEWKGSWSVANGELAIVSGPIEERWGARHEPHGWVLDRNRSGDDRTFKVEELTHGRLRLETLAIGDVNRSMQRTATLPQRPVLTNPKP